MLTASTDFPMPIITPRLLLCQPVASDAKKYFDAVTESMNEITLWLPWAKHYPTMIQVMEYIKECNNNWITKKFRSTTERKDNESHNCNDDNSYNIFRKWYISHICI